MHIVIKVILGIVIVFVGIVALALASYYSMSDEERARLDAEREAERIEKMHEETMKALQENNERAKASWEPETVPSGSWGAERLKYRPHWLVGDEWDERERTGKISTSYECASAVTTISESSGSIRETFYQAWLKECVDWTN